MMFKYSELLQNKFSSLSETVKVIEYVSRGNSCSVCGLGGGAPALLCSEIWNKTGSTILVITADENDARRLIDDIKFFNAKVPVCLFPDLNIPPYEDIIPARSLYRSRHF